MPFFCDLRIICILFTVPREAIYSEEPKEMRFVVGFGQDSHRFENEKGEKACIIAGHTFPDVPGFDANSDGDIVYHALCNAITSVTGVLILGGIADDLCLEKGITDSEVYLREALKTLGDLSIEHVALSIEGLRPKFKPHIDAMKGNLSKVLKISEMQIGITATTGEGLTGFGRGEGVQCLAVVTFSGRNC